MTIPLARLLLETSPSSADTVLLPDYTVAELHNLVDLAYHRREVAASPWPLGDEVANTTTKNTYHDQPEDLSIHRRKSNPKKTFNCSLYLKDCGGKTKNNNKSQSSSSKPRRRRSEAQAASKAPTWTQSQMFQAIDCVIRQQLRFTQASLRFGIPKGTLYDNILGKASRMRVLQQVGLSPAQEMEVLEFCCQVSAMPYNRRIELSTKFR